MKAEEEYPKGKKYRATTLQKIQLFSWKLQTILNKLKRVSKEQIHDLLTEIQQKLSTFSPANIREGLKALGNLLTTSQREMSQSIAHKFIPHALRLMSSHYHSSVVWDSIQYLAKVISFGKLSEECLKLFEESVIQLLVGLVKEGISDQKGQLYALVANLAIDSVAMRDLFIEKGAVDAIISALPSLVVQNKSQSLQIAYFALTALTLGDPLPPRHSVEKAVNRIVAEIDDPGISLKRVISRKNAVGAFWVLYHYFDYRNQEQCVIFLKRLTMARQNSQYKSAHFNRIFIEIYDYYSVKPDNEIMPILHGSFYKDPPLQIFQTLQLFRQYTPKMYQDLFRATLPHKITERGRNLLLEYPWKQAVSFLKQEDEYTDRVLTLEFILWALNQMTNYTYNRSQQLNKTQPRIQDTCLISWMLCDIKSNLFIIKKLRHDNRRLLASLSSAVIKAYRELSINNKGYFSQRYTFE